MANEIKVGDLVQLKSGGPKMTVTSIGDYYGTLMAWCSWFSDVEEKDGSFPVAALKLAE